MPLMQTLSDDDLVVRHGFNLLLLNQNILVVTYNADQTFFGFMSSDSYGLNSV